MTLDEAWAAVERVLPKGWVIRGVQRFYVHSDRWAWQASAMPLLDPLLAMQAAEGPTPTAALQELARLLQETER